MPFISRALAAACCAGLFVAASLAAAAADAPLRALPHTPSLDPAAMDRAADPCEDFYQYSCGGWLSSNPVPADQASWGVYGKLYQDNQRFLWGILDDLAAPVATRTPAQQKIGDYFAACMDEAAIDARGAAPLQPMLERIAALRSKRDLAGLIADLQLQTDSGGFLFGFGSSQDFTDSERVIAFASAGGLGLPDRDYYTDRDAHAVQLRRQYLDHVARMFTLLGDDAAQSRHHAATVMRLETSLARATLTRVELRDPYRLLHKLSLAQLVQLSPGFDWATYLAALGVSDTGPINVTEPRFFATLSRVIGGASLDDLRTYLRWHAISASAALLAHPFAAEQFAFYDHVLRGVPAQPPRWQRCVRHVDVLLGDALGQEYVARTFGPALRAAALQMTTQIEQAMRQDIEELTWMSEATKHQALAKLDAIVNKIGYPDHWRDYGAVAIVRDDFYGNTVSATRFESQRTLARIAKPLDRSEWSMTPPTVNAYFDPQLNDINFPAGILQPPLYDPLLDDAPNYGNTGSTIGHELTHAFDDEGRKYDAHGNLKDWWTPADARHFQDRAECLVEQNSAYVVVDDLHSNGRLTLGEDVADLGGLILAHMAWKVQTATMSLPNRDGLTPEQRFFVGYAQWACQNDRPEELRLLVKTDPHSTARLRINGTVVDMPEFRQAFACRAGQAMVKPKICRVW
jgi:endothelin-converting enzyme/putative endopeptidase